MKLEELEKKIEGIEKIAWDAKSKILYLKTNGKEYGFPFPNVEIAMVIIESMRYVPKLIAVAKAVKSLPWGGARALPCCIELFPELNKALKELEK